METFHGSSVTFHPSLQTIFPRGSHFHALETSGLSTESDCQILNAAFCPNRSEVRMKCGRCIIAARKALIPSTSIWWISRFCPVLAVAILSYLTKPLSERTLSG